MTWRGWARSLNKARPFITPAGWTPGAADRQRRPARPVRAAARAVGAVLMYAVALPERGDLAEWRDAARGRCRSGIPPELVDWTGGRGLFAAAPLPDAPGRISAGAAGLPRAGRSGDLPRRPRPVCAALSRSGGSPAGGRPRCPMPIDAGRRLRPVAKSVRRDFHKMHAFVRFREMPAEGRRRALRRLVRTGPPHRGAGRPSFARRFADMDWMIVTPRLTAPSRTALELRPGRRAARPARATPTEALWLTYFANIFNPARVKVEAMRAEMPKKYWKNLPETALIPDAAGARPGSRMREAGPRCRAGAPGPSRRATAPDATTRGPAQIAGGRARPRPAARAAPLQAATQTVFGEGPKDAALMIVGEQPGDREDLPGAPSSAPPARCCAQAWTAAGLDRAAIWLTNAVKHFKFTRAASGACTRTRTGVRSTIAAGGSDWSSTSSVRARPWRSAPLRRSR